MGIWAWFTPPTGYTERFAGRSAAYDPLTEFPTKVMFI